MSCETTKCLKEFQELYYDARTPVWCSNWYQIRIYANLGNRNCRIIARLSPFSRTLDPFRSELMFLPRIRWWAEKEKHQHKLRIGQQENTLVSKERTQRVCSLQMHIIPYFGDNFAFCAEVGVSAAGSTAKTFLMLPNAGLSISLQFCDFNDVCMCNEPSTDAAANNSYSSLPSPHCVCNVYSIQIRMLRLHGRSCVRL